MRHYQILLISLCLATGFTTAQAELSPLLEQAYQLKCAIEQKSAKQAIENLRNNSIHSLGLPTENLNDNPNSFLTAGSLDITLHTLVNAAIKFPELQNLVERTILKWDYCHVFENQLFYDVLPDQTRHLVDYSSPLNWTGFQALGFLDEPAKFIPSLLSHSSSRNQAFEMFFHRIYQQQCFPHPETGKLYHRLYQTKTQLRITDKRKHSDIYPYSWKTSCPSDEPKVKIIPPPPIIASIPKMVPAIKPIFSVTKIIISKTAPQAIIEKKAPQSEPIISIDKKSTQVNSIPPVEVEKSAAMPSIIVEFPPPSDEQPITNIVTPTNSFNSAPITSVISEHPEDTHGFTGNIYTKQSLSGNNPTIGAMASWKPISDSFWFVRAGIDYDYKIESPLTYSWGIGYDDWHEGTWSAQINNWGPLESKKGLELDKAIINIGYKLKSQILANYKLHANTSLDIPIKGEPALNLGMQWTPIENWYVRTNTHLPLNGSSAIWSYGFGYSNWRANKINIEYSNYGENKLFNPNFKDNGVVSMSYNWEF